jgi:hypothetical protein
MEYDPPLPHYIDMGQLFKGNIERINDTHTFQKYGKDARGNRIVYFSGEDTPRVLKSNLDIFPEDWHYRHKQVTYRCNSRFYRYDELDTVDWANSVVIFGCSQIQGQGLAEDETISEQLAQLLGRPVVNLGVGGSGMMFNLHNSIMFLKNFPTPWALVQHWPNLDRIHVFEEYIRNLGPWEPTEHPLFMAWNQNESNSQMHAIFVDEASKQIWKDRTRYVSITQSYYTAQAINCDFVERLDFARDNGHGGPKTAVSVAQRLAERLR